MPIRWPPSARPLLHGTDVQFMVASDIEATRFDFDNEAWPLVQELYGDESAALQHADEFGKFLAAATLVSSRVRQRNDVRGAPPLLNAAASLGVWRRRASR